MIWFTSDTHFFHKNVIDYCKRPYESVEEMNSALIANWNRVVGSSDTVYHLGDFFIAKRSQYQEILDRLNGHIILIRGNHDRESTKKYLDLGFDAVFLSGLIVPVENIRVWMNHFPWGPDERGFERPKCHPSSYDLALCGHVHTAWRYKDGLYNVGVDVNNYTPVSLRHILDNIASREGDEK